ncbi:hypothetical protein [Kitasatospora paranensis]|uniref:Integral membrane protein n=1 Tax=Kitasatospora paranensis TaxID=258053 RepID=A0ABW2GCK9_9ACTN
MLVETIACALIGLAVGVGALVLLPAYFPASRTLTLSTALVAALLSGLIARYALDGRLPGVALVVSALGSGLLVSVLARPDLAARRGTHRRHRHV